MIGVRRLAHVSLSTPDLARQIEYFVEIMGLTLIERSRDRAVLATKVGVEAVVLEKGESAGLLRLAFQIAPEMDVRTAARKLLARGISSETRSGITPGVENAIAFSDPGGTLMEIFSEYKFAPRDPKPLGIMPAKIGHVARWVMNVREMETFYTEVLGFRVSDWRGEAGVFMRCGPDHHTVNVFQAERAGLAHIAFEVKDWAELQRACEVLAGYGLRLDWGPSRHNIGHNIACYHKNWDGLRVEIYTEMDLMNDEALGYFEPRPWHENLPQRPKVWPDSTSKNYWGLWGAT